MKKRKFISIVLSSIMILGLLTGCGASNNMIASPSYNENGLEVMGMGAADSTTGFGGIFDSITSSKSESAVVEDSYYAPQAPNKYDVSEIPKPETESVTENYLEKKLVYSANIDAQTKDMTQAKTDIDKMIADMNGYIESEYSYKNGGFDYGYTRTTLEMKIRVPGSKFQEFLNGLESENIYVNNLNKSSVDYSTSYYDKESRINSLRIQEERLYELLAGAQDIDVMLRIENQLSNIRYEIESLTKEMRFIDSQVDYSTINLNIEQVVKYDISNEEPITFLEELVERIKDSGEDFVEFLKGLLFVIIAIFPYLVLLVIIIIILRPFIKKRKIKRAEKKLAKLEKQRMKYEKASKENNLPDENSDNINV